MNALLQQAQPMQEQMVRRPGGARRGRRRRHGRRRVVTVTVNGTGELVGVKIRANSFDPSPTPRTSRTSSSPPTATPKAQPTRWPSEALGPLAGGLAAWPGGAPGSPAGGCRMYEGVVQDLIDELGRLPGVGPKSAQRIAFHLLQADPADVRRLAEVLVEVKERVRFCSVCGNVAEEDLPDLPRPPARPGGDLRVEESKDVVAIERTREFSGRYHVLGGAISPIEGIGPDQLRIRELMTRLADGSGHRGHPRHRPEPRGRGHRDVPHAVAHGPWAARDASCEWTPRRW